MIDVEIRRAIETKLISDHSWITSENCKRRMDGRPHPVLGQDFFVAIHPMTSTGNKHPQLGTRENFSVGVTLTVRSAKYNDRILAEKLDTILYPKLYDIRTTIHQNYTLFAAINTLIGDVSKNLTEPLEFNSQEAPSPVGADWFSASPNSQRPDYGYKSQITFSNAVGIFT